MARTKSTSIEKPQQPPKPLKYHRIARKSSPVTTGVKGWRPASEPRIKMETQLPQNQKLTVHSHPTLEFCPDYSTPNPA